MQTSGTGIFSAKYVGCLEVYASMKVLDFQTRSAVARECIHRVLDATSSKTPHKRKVEKRVQNCINMTPCLEHSGTDVFVNVSPKLLEIKTADSNEVVTRHEMHKISFASGGDFETLDFIAYIAKDIADWRACYVLEMPNQLAQQVISVMGQAFEIRYREYYGAEKDKMLNFPEHLRPLPKPKNDQEYYNDLPGKIPPDLVSLNIEKSPKTERRRERISSNLIELDTPPIDHNYINEPVFEVKDDFEIASSSSDLTKEKWFHGIISRVHAEQQLKNDGDFLVRESQNTRGQFVLTGMNFGQPKHLLLIDPEGRVRTKDRVFKSVSHLINYHFEKSLPIISAETSLVLERPVPRNTNHK